MKFSSIIGMHGFELWYGLGYMVEIRKNQAGYFQVEGRLRRGCVL